MIPFGFMRAASAPAVFDPATLSATGWYRADSTTGYDNGGGSGIWLPVASAGSSGSRANATEATNFPGETAVNGHYAPNFDGTNDRLGTTSTLDDFINAGAFGCWILFEADTAPADPGAANRYQAAQLVTDVTDAYFHMGLTANGVHVSNDAGATYRQVACATGVHLAQASYNGTTLSLRVDGGVASTTGGSNTAGLTRTMRFGANYANTAFYDGRIIEIMFFDAAPSSTDENNYKSYCNARYALAL